MKRLLFDIESDNLLHAVTKVHCIAIMDIDSGKLWSHGPDDIEKALDELYQADELIGHNIVQFDLRVLAKLHNWHPRPGCRLTDTLVVARLLKPNLKNEDFERKDFPRELIGRNSLEAWGKRLGVVKMDFKGPWEHWSQEMQDYCEGDLRTNFALLTHLKPWEYPPVPLALEHRVQHVCGLMKEEGWPFDMEKAQSLYVTLVERRDQLEKALVEKFGEWQEVDKVYVAKKDNAKRGIKKGDTVTNYKTVIFNPGSRVHIEKKLRELGWEPQQFTESGRAKIDEPVLLGIDIPEAQLLVDYLLVQKRLGQLADGDNGWMRLVKDGKIHATTDPGGTITGRAAHYGPNIAQVPAVKGKKGLVPYGRECRELFHVPSEWGVQVGADMSGLELRTFAHYLAYFDNGAYGDVVLNGDIHTHNQQAAGLPTRDMAKTFIYALLYGAGDAKIGSIIGGSERDGKKLKQRFFAGLPAYKQLRESVDLACKKGYLTALDGRRLYVRSSHAALNTLLQGAGAILCKQWLADFYDAMLAEGFKHGWDGDFVIMGFIHDETAVASRREILEETKELIVSTAVNAGKPFGFKIPLASECKVGSNWSETH